LGGLQYSWNNAPILAHVDQHRRCRQVEIPHVVMDQLMEPLQLSRIRIESKKRVGIKVLAGYGMICVSCWREYDSSLFIDNHRRPDVGAASVLPGIPGPVFMVWFSRLRDDMKIPNELPCDGVPCANVTSGLWRQSLARARAADDQIFVDGNRIRDRKGISSGFAHSVGYDIFVNVYYAAGTETRDGLARLQTDRRQI